MSRIIDCSMIVSQKMWRSIWKVDISTHKGDIQEVEGDLMQPCASILHLSAHCGTHIDSPLHVMANGPTIDEIPLDRCCGDAAVIDLTDKGELEPITAEDMEERGKHIRADDIVLLKTGWTEKNAGGNAEYMEGLPKDTDYWKGPYPSPDMAEWMVKRKVKAVGYDCPNDWNHHLNIKYDYMRKGSPADEHEHVHRIHLSHGILQIEYLCNLTAIKKDRVQFFAVPLKIKAEGSPVRAFVIED